MAALATTASAQGAPALQFLVSTTNDAGALDPALPLLEDTDILTVGGAQQPQPWFSRGHWRALGSFAPSDVDALATIYGEPRAGDFFTSFLSDEGGFKDGDIVALSADGQFFAAIEEEAIAAALGDALLNIDVDALAFDGDGPLGSGRMLFSLADNITTPALGAILDGDVLALDATGSITRLYTEAEVSVDLSSAIGANASATDVFGLEYVAGEVWVSVQSPSSHDGAVIALGVLARVVAQESDFALAGEEIDALMLLHTAPPPCLWFETTPGGFTGRGAIAHGTPGGLVVLLASGTAGWLATPALGGFGGFALEGTDPLLNTLLAGPSLPMVVLDAQGGFARPISLDTGDAGAGIGGAAGITFQALDVSSLRVSPPFRILL